MGKTLCLPLKKEWYEMIESGAKTEEYREGKLYWCKRLVGKNFTHVKFSYGYTKRTMTFGCKGITIGKGKKEWGAPDKDVFIIKLGNELNNYGNTKDLRPIGRRLGNVQRR